MTELMRQKCERSCRTCAHKYGILLNECAVTGHLCNLEMVSGGRCCQPDGKLALWHPRPSIFNRILRVIFGVRGSSIEDKEH